jgi:hypothetical protein
VTVLLQVKMMSSRENEMLMMELSLFKVKGHVQPFQDNSEHMVKKLEK